MDKSYKAKLDAKVEGLRKKLEKIEAAKTFDQTPAGQIIVEHIQGEVNSIFKDMTNGDPLDREEYLVAHASISLYRGILVAISNQVREEQKAKRELEDATEQQRTAAGQERTA